MVNYTCEKCNKEFTKKCHYLTHMNKKKPCEIINQHNANESLTNHIEAKINHNESEN